MIAHLFVRRSAAGTVALLLGGGMLCCPANADDALQKHRAELAAKHDANGDGRLDAAERERMRLALKEQRLGRKGSGFPIPADFLAKYDANKDGEMAGPEWKVAWDAETNILRDTYDADHDGTLGPAEQRAMLADVGNGKITGIPAFFAGRMVQDQGAGQPDYLATQQALLKFDDNHDGVASAEELERIRQSRTKTP